MFITLIYYVLVATFNNFVFEKVCSLKSLAAAAPPSNDGASSGELDKLRHPMWTLGPRSLLSSQFQHEYHSGQNDSTVDVVQTLFFELIITVTTVIDCGPNVF